MEPKASAGSAPTSTIEPSSSTVPALVREANANRPPIGLLGWSAPAIAGLQALGRRFVVVGPEDFTPIAADHGVDFVGWDFERRNEQSGELAETLLAKGIAAAVPLYEECVSWAGAINGRIRKDPRLFNRALLFRDKAMMKRKAQMSGIRVGVFEEADDIEDVRRFFERVNKALLKLDGEPGEPVHLKPIAAAGSVGHHMIRSAEDVDQIDASVFPCLLESHLDGQEFSCEVFIHGGKIRFLNVTQYIHLGHSNFVPAGPALAEKRDLIRAAIEQLIEAFGIEYGMIHPEYFVTADGKLNFGEVAARVPGGHIFELIQRAYGFDPFAGFALCSDPATTEAELEAFFPKEDEFSGYAGCLMVYPSGPRAAELRLPPDLESDPFYERHNLFVPFSAKVAARVGFGNHYGTVFYFGDDAPRMTDLLKRHEEFEFYV